MGLCKFGSQVNFVMCKFGSRVNLVFRKCGSRVKCENVNLGKRQAPTFLLIRFGEEDADNHSDTSVTVFVYVLVFHILESALMDVTIC